MPGRAQRPDLPCARLQAALRLRPRRALSSAEATNRLCHHDPRAILSKHYSGFVRTRPSGFVRTTTAFSLGHRDEVFRESPSLDASVAKRGHAPVCATDSNYTRRKRAQTVSGQRTGYYVAFAGQDTRLGVITTPCGNLTPRSNLGSRNSEKTKSPSRFASGFLNSKFQLTHARVLVQ